MFKMDKFIYEIIKSVTNEPLRKGKSLKRYVAACVVATDEGGAVRGGGWGMRLRRVLHGGSCGSREVGLLVT